MSWLYSFVCPDNIKKIEKRKGKLVFLWILSVRSV
jgi:hypothetical protein